MREFLVADFGIKLGKGTWAARTMITNALDVRDRLPRIWARLQAGKVRVYLAEKVAERTHHLSAEAADLVDAEMVEYADGRLSWTRFQAVLEGKIVVADPETAARREREAAERQFAKSTRSSEDGMKGFYIRSSVAVIVRFEATVTFYANALKQLGDPDTEDIRRVKACLILANPPQAIELLQAFANHRAQQSTNDSEDGADGSSGDEPDAPSGENSGDRPLPIGEDDDLAGEDDLPIGEGDIHPSQNDADDPDPDTCPTCGAGMSGNPEPFMKPFQPGDIPPDASAGPFRFDWTRLLPRVTLYLHLSQDTIIRDRGGVARWEGEAPVTVQYVREYLAPFHRFVIQPVIDLENQAPVDAHEIPDRHRQAVHLRTPADTFPYSSNTARSKDIDHTKAYVPMAQGGEPGQSRLDNYGPMVRFHHRIKTFGPWEVRQPFPGIYIWRTPFGEYYLVDHTGTRKISPTNRTGAEPDTRGRPRHHNRDIAIQVYRERDPIEYEYTHEI